MGDTPIYTEIQMESAISQLVEAVRVKIEVIRSNDVKKECMEVMSLIDEIKEKISDGEYLKLCNLMGKIHNK